MRKYRYILDQVEQLTPTAFNLRLVPKDEGQKVDFKPGQYVSFSYQADGFSAPVRSFSITNAPDESGALEFGIRTMGTYTQALKTVQSGTKFDVYGPGGSFTLNPDLPAVFLAAGIGITPFTSMIQAAAESGFKQKITLIYSNRNEHDAPYFAELDRIASSNKAFTFIPRFSDTDGMLTGEEIAKLAPYKPGEAQYLLCGPAPFMAAMHQSLSQVPRKLIKMESFSQSVSAKKEVLVLLGFIPLIFALLYFSQPHLPDFATFWPRYLTRSAGLTAELLLALTVAMGIGMVAGYTYRIFEPVKAWAVHRALGISFFISMLVHVGSIMFDKLRGFTLAELLIPFVADFKPFKIGSVSLGSFWVALGITAFYLSIPVIYTSLVTIDRNQKIWRWLHYCNYLIAPLIFFHALYTGTDFSNPVFQAVGLTLGILLFLGMTLRLGRRNKRIKSR